MKTIQLRLLALAILASAAVASAPAAAQGVGQGAAAARRQVEQEGRRLRTRMLQSLFQSRVDLDHRQAPASDVFDALRTQLGVNVVVHYEASALGPGIDPDSPITIQATDLLGVEAMELVVEQCAALDPCTWQLRGSFIEVGTKARLAAPSARQVRTFPVQELLYQAPDFDNAPLLGFAGAYGPNPYFDLARSSGSVGVGLSRGAFGPRSGSGFTYGAPAAAPTQSLEERARELIRVIVDVVEPEAWTENGGEWASIHYQDGVLIVRAPDFVQRQLFGYETIAPAPAGPGAKP